MEYVLVIFPIAMIKYLNKNNLRKEGFIVAHSSRLQSTMVEKAQW